MSRAEKIMEKIAGQPSSYGLNLLSEDYARSSEIPESYKLKKLEVDE